MKGLGNGPSVPEFSRPLLKKREKGRTRPNPQAAALVLLVRRYPDTLARLDELAAR